MPRPRTPPVMSLSPAIAKKRRLQLLRSKLTAERASWTRWMSRLKRAFHSVEKILARVSRLEREIARLE